MEMMREDPKSIPRQVEFVLSTMDRVQIPANLRSKESAPFAISFAHAPGHLDVPIPDPSFWSWPEMLIPPFWEVLWSIISLQCLLCSMVAVGGTNLTFHKLSFITVVLD